MLEILVNLFVGLAVAGLATVQWLVSRRDELEHRKAESEAGRVRQADEKLQQTRDRDAKVAVWGGMVIDLMADLEVACAPSARGYVARPEQFDALGSRASALVHRGRLFFPNFKPEQGEGFRVEILDHVLRACYVARHVAANGTGDGALMRHHVWQARCRFVALLQGEMRDSLRTVTLESVGVSVPVDPRQWEKPTMPMKLPTPAEGHSH